MFEFLVIAILIGVLFGIRNLLKKTEAQAHETRVLQQRLESVSQHLTSISSALRAKTIGESPHGRGHKVSLQARSGADEFVKRVGGEDIGIQNGNTGSAQGVHRGFVTLAPQPQATRQQTGTGDQSQNDEHLRDWIGFFA